MSIAKFCRDSVLTSLQTRPLHCTDCRKRFVITQQSFFVIRSGVSGGWATERRRLLRIVVCSDSMLIQCQCGLVRHGQLRGVGIVYFESLVQAE
jgi:hypothetical protein